MKVYTLRPSAADHDTGADVIFIFYLINFHKRWRRCGATSARPFYSHLWPVLHSTKQDLDPTGNRTSLQTLSHQLGFPSAHKCQIYRSSPKKSFPHNSLWVVCTFLCSIPVNLETPKTNPASLERQKAIPLAQGSTSEQYLGLQEKVCEKQERRKVTGLKTICNILETSSRKKFKSSSSFLLVI